MTGVRKTRYHIEVVKVGSPHIGYFLQSVSAGGSVVWSGDVVSINGHGEALSGVTYGFLTTGDRETGKEEFVWYMEK